MARQIKNRLPKKSIAVVVDGKDEKIYVYKAKEHSTNELLKRSKVKPEISDRKKSVELFRYAQDRLSEGYTQVVLIIDLDNIKKDEKDFIKFRSLYEKYLAVNNGTHRGRQINWMKKLVVLINNPCLEYWYLLHFSKTTKFYDCYASLKMDLVKIDELKDYEKTEKYYTNSPDIFLRLGGLQGLETARANSKGSHFSLSTCYSVGISEMGRFFDLFE